MKIKTLQVDGFGPAIHGMVVEEYERYVFLSTGEVIDLNKRKCCCVDISSGRPRITLIKDKGKQRVYIDELLYEIFCGKIEPGNRIWHVDGNILNNNISNLQQVALRKYKFEKRKIKQETPPEFAVQIPGHPDYFCDKQGTIYGKKGMPMKGHVDKHGYMEVLLSENGKAKKYFVHRLVLSTFNPCVGNKNLQVNHINGIKTDNKLENLEWCTRSENLLHAYKNNLERKMIGINHWRHIFTQEQVDDIRTNCVPRKKGSSIADFARKYSCDQSTISSCLKGVTYSEN